MHKPCPPGTSCARAHSLPVHIQIGVKESNRHRLLHITNKKEGNGKFGQTTVIQAQQTNSPQTDNGQQTSNGQTNARQADVRLYNFLIASKKKKKNVKTMPTSVGQNHSPQHEKTTRTTTTATTIPTQIGRTISFCGCRY